MYYLQAIGIYAAAFSGLLSIALPLKAATPGLPFTEDFTDTTLRDTAHTTAHWNTAEKALVLSSLRRKFEAFGINTAASDITSDIFASWSMAIGDVNGDGKLDVVTGNFGEANRL